MCVCVRARARKWVRGCVLCVCVYFPLSSLVLISRPFSVATCAPVVVHSSREVLPVVKQRTQSLWRRWCATTTRVNTQTRAHTRTYVHHASTHAHTHTYTPCYTNCSPSNASAYTPTTHQYCLLASPNSSDHVQTQRFLQISLNPKTNGVCHPCVQCESARSMQ